MEMNIKKILLACFAPLEIGSEYHLLLPATKVLINSGDTIGLRTIPISLSRYHMANYDGTFHWQKLLKGCYYEDRPCL